MFTKPVEPSGPGEDYTIMTDDPGRPAVPPPDIGPKPSPPPFTPPPDDTILEGNKGPTTFADLLFGESVAKNTKDTADAIRDLADAVSRGNTRSSRTALA